MKKIKIAAEEKCFKIQNILKGNFGRKDYYFNTHWNSYVQNSAIEKLAPAYRKEKTIAGKL